MNWEGRGGSFEAALRVPEVRTDLYVLGAIADRMDVHLGPARRGGRAGRTRRARHLARGAAAAACAVSRATPIPAHRTSEAHGPGASAVRLATWHQLLDSGRMQDGEPALAGHGPPGRGPDVGGDRGRGRGGRRR